MGHFKKIYRCRHGSQVEEYHSTRRHAPGEKRRERSKPTPEKVKENNIRIKKQKIQRLLLHYFDEGDKYVTLTYPKEDPPNDLKQVQRDMRKLIAFLKPKYVKAGIELMWIRNIERTKRGIYHIHLLVKNLPDINIGKIIRDYWREKHGKIVKVEDIYLDGGFEKLAGYMAKTERDEEGNVISSYSHSRNMKDIEPEVIEYSRWNTRSNGEWKEVKVPKGYELIKDSLYEGVNDITGFPYRRYLLLRQKGERHARTSIRGD